MTQETPKNAEVLTIHVQVADARELRRIESRLSKLAKIVTQTYLRAPDKNGFYQIQSASYVVLTEDPRRLKITLRQLGNSGKATISF